MEYGHDHRNLQPYTDHARKCSWKGALLSAIGAHLDLGTHGGAELDLRSRSSSQSARDAHLQLQEESNSEVLRVAAGQENSQHCGPAQVLVR